MSDLPANATIEVVENGHVVRVARPAGQGRPCRRRRTPRASSSCGTRSAGSSATRRRSSRRTTISARGPHLPATASRAAQADSTRASTATYVWPSVLDTRHVVRIARPAGPGRASCEERRRPARRCTLWDEIRRLKRDKRAFVPAHNYQVPEVQAIADTVGDSFELAVRARDIDANLVVFCGVRFMAEGCHTLAPERPVYLPNLRGALLAGRGRRRRRRRAAGVPARGRAPLRDHDLREHLRRREGAVRHLLHQLERGAHRGQAGRARPAVRPRPEPRLPGRAQHQAHVPAAARAAQVPPARVRGDGRAADPRGRAAGAGRQRVRLGGRLPRPPPDDRRRHRAHPPRRSRRRP